MVLPLAWLISIVWPSSTSRFANMQVDQGSGPHKARTIAPYHCCSATCTTAVNRRTTPVQEKRTKQYFGRSGMLQPIIIIVCLGATRHDSARSCATERKARQCKGCLTRGFLKLRGRRGGVFLANQSQNTWRLECSSFLGSILYAIGKQVITKKELHIPYHAILYHTVLYHTILSVYIYTHMVITK